MNSISIIEAIVIWLLPPGLSMALGVLGLVLWRWHALSRFLLALGALVLVVSSLPVVGLWLESRLSGRVELANAAAGAGAQADPVVVLTGGIYADGQGGWWPGAETVQRAMAAVAYAETHKVPLIIAGGSPRPDVPQEAYVAVGRMRLSEDSLDLITVAAGRTTQESAAPVAERLRQQGIARVVVATDPTHSLRAAAALRSQGIDVSGRIRVGPRRRTAGWLLWIPSLHGLSATRSAVYEFVALAWYLLRGYVDWSDLAESGKSP